MPRQTEAELIELLGPNQSARRRYGEWFDYAWAYFGDACAYCQGMARVSTANSYGPVLKTFDHLIPESRGGTNDKWNLIPACHFCNSAKGGRDALAWYQRQPFYSAERWARIVGYIEMVRAWGDKV